MIEMEMLIAVVVMVETPEALAEFKQGHFLRAAQAAGLPDSHTFAKSFKSLAKEVRKEIKAEIRAGLEETRRAHARLVEHARYARRKALGMIPGVDPTKPAVQKTVGGQSRADIRQQQKKQEAAKVAEKARRRKLRPAAEAAARHAVRITPQYRRMNAAYMRWYMRRTPERRAEFEAARKTWQAELAGIREAGVEAKIKIYGGEK